jgi:transposase InsO family protein
MCELAQVSRSGFYRWRPEHPPRDPHQRLRNEIRKTARRWPAYGTRRVTAELRQRGWAVNRKPVQRLMREDHLLCRRKRKFVVTTDSNHQQPVYRNLACDLVLTDLDQLWVADITYIRLEEEFVYLAVILDAYSRRVVGWALDQTMASELALAALEMALRRRKPDRGLVHHSDRGVQYASQQYTGRLQEAGLLISMSRKASPWENGACESFLKTLKHEEVHRTEYRGLAHARSRIRRFLERVYNQQRLHSALDYLSPMAFERSLLTPKPPASRPTV